MIHTNSFTDPQCRSIRSTGVIRGATALEVGWIKNLGSPAEVFYFWAVDGIPTGLVENTGITPAPGSNKTYKVEDGNSDQDWGIFYENNRLDGVYLGAAQMTRFQTNSEKEFGQDSLWAHFDNLRECFDQGCDNYQVPSAFSEDVNNSANWKWCKISNAEHYVKQSC